MEAEEHEDIGPAAWHLVGTAAVAALLVMQFFTQTESGLPLRILGILLLGASVIFMFPPFLHLSRHGGRRQGMPYYRTTVLVDRGLYSVVRHPQYVGYILLVLGLAALARSVGSALLAGLAALAFYAQSIREEEHCLERFGAPYADYMRRVPRFNVLAGILRSLRADSRQD